MERVEINDVKAGLISNLSRDRAEEYWACIRSFLGAKLTKYEFDCQVFHLLGPENGEVTLVCAHQRAESKCARVREQREQAEQKAFLTEIHSAAA